MDYSTGSVGIGATAPIWGAIARRYVDASLGGAGTGRQYSLVGDAELDEGAVWEAVLDHSVAELGEIVWIVDLNRQSLDRVVPNIAATRLERMFSGAGWQVITVKFGALLESLFTRPGGTALRERILDMPNPEYQRLLRCTADEVRLRLPGDAVDADAITALIDDLDDATVLEAIRNLGGHDLDALREAYAQIDDTRPTVIIAYTIKGRGLPTQGHPQNHSSLLTTEQYEILAAELGMDPSNPWERFETDSPSGRICAETAGRLAPPEGGASGAPGSSERHRPYALRHVHHSGSSRPGTTRPQPRSAGRRETCCHTEPGRQFHHQPRRLAEQGRRVVPRRAAQLVCRRRRNDHALA